MLPPLRRFLAASRKLLGRDCLRPADRPARCRPRLESLEGRIVPADATLLSKVDPGFIADTAAGESGVGAISQDGR